MENDGRKNIMLKYFIDQLFIYLNYTPLLITSLSFREKNKNLSFFFFLCIWSRYQIFLMYMISNRIVQGIIDFILKTFDFN